MSLSHVGDYYVETYCLCMYVCVREWGYFSLGNANIFCNGLGNSCCNSFNKLVKCQMDVHWMCWMRFYENTLIFQSWQVKLSVILADLLLTELKNLSQRHNLDFKFIKKYLLCLFQTVISLLGHLYAVIPERVSYAETQQIFIIINIWICSMVCGAILLAPSAIIKFFKCLGLLYLCWARYLRWSLLLRFSRYL